MAKIISNITYMKNVQWYREMYTLKKALKPLDNKIQVLFKSKHFLIVNKPADLICYNFNENQKNTPTLFDYLREQFPFYYDSRLTGGFHVLHRLDSVTSGVICVPLNYFSQRLAVQAFTSGNAEKYYLSLVYGRLKTADPTNEFLIDEPIGDDLENLKYSRVAQTNLNGKLNENCVNAQKCKTKIKILEYGTYKGKECTKLLVQPVTGKRHQIRVHLKHIGYPIVGDLVYGRDDFDSYRTMLHAYKLVLRINTKERMFIKAKAEDPFINKTDPDWIPNETVNQLKI